MITPAGGDKDEGRLADQVRALDPTVRALLDLTLRRGFSDGEIGDLLGVPPDQATRMREQALDRLADGSDGGRDQIEADLKAFGDEVWILDGSGEPAETSESTDTEPQAAREEGAETTSADGQPADSVEAQPELEVEPEPDAEPEPEFVDPPEPEPEPPDPEPEPEVVDPPEPEGVDNQDEPEPEFEPAVIEPEEPVEDKERDGPGAVAQGPGEAGDDEESEDRRGRIPPVWLAPLIALIAIALVIWVIAMGNDDTSAPQSTDPAPTVPTNTNPAAPPPAAPPQRKPKPAPPPAKPPAPKPQGTTAAPLPGRGTPGKVSVSREGNDLLVNLRGLPDPHGGAYAVWLYDSLIDSKRIGVATKGNATIKAPLPPDARGFRFLDISRESSSQDSTHSGESLFRVALPPLLS